MTLKKLNVALLVASMGLALVSTSAHARAPGTRYTRVPTPQINTTSEQIVEKQSAFFGGEFKWTCTGDNGRIMVGVGPSSYTRHKVENGVERTLDAITANSFTTRIAIRGDSEFFTKLTPYSQDFVKNNIGSDGYFVVETGGSLPGYVVPIPFDGLEAKGESVAHVTNATFAQRYFIADSVEAARKSDYHSFKKVSTKEHPHYVPSDYPLSRHYVDFNTLALLFSGEFTLKLNKDAGYTSGVGGLFKKYILFTKDLRGETVTEKDTPKPLFTTECNLVRYATSNN